MVRSRPTNRMKPTRLAVRDRDLVDSGRSRQVLSLRQFAQPAAFARNSRKLLDWMEKHDLTRDFLTSGSWQNAEPRRFSAPWQYDDGRSDDADRDVAGELMSPRLGDLGLANLPFAIFVRELDVLRAAAAIARPASLGFPSGAVKDPTPADAAAAWRAAWSKPTGGLQPEQWFDSARRYVPHIGDAQRRPIEQLGYDAVSQLLSRWPYIHRREFPRGCRPGDIDPLSGRVRIAGHRRPGGRSHRLMFRYAEIYPAIGPEHVPSTAGDIVCLS